MDRRRFLARMLASGSLLLLEGACGSDSVSSTSSAQSNSVETASTVVVSSATAVSGTSVKVASNPFPDLPVQVYDQGMGVTDSTGLVIGFPLRTTGSAKQVWANTATGSTSYNGFSPYPGYRLNGTGPNYQYSATGRGAADSAYGPKPTYAAAVGAVTITGIGEAHQFFFAEGQSFVIDATVANYYGGVSASFPVCFQSYDPADPLNLAKQGRAGTGSQGARPIWTAGTSTFPSVTRGDGRDYGNWAFRGIKCVSSGDAQSFYFVYCQNNMLFENMVFDNIEIVIANYNPIDGFSTGNNNIIRRCSSYGQYDSKGSHSCGVYSYHTNLTIEDSVWWHCGWKVGASRDDAVAAGGPDIFKHCLYIANGMGTTTVIRRNVCADGAAAGLSLRGNHRCSHNVIIDCPTPDFSGGGSSSDADNPNGVSQQAWCHLVMGGADISTSLPRGMGFSASDGTRDSFYNYCLYVNNPRFGAVNNQWLAVATNTAQQPSYMSFTGNRAYAFAPASRRLVRSVYSPGIDQNINILADQDNVANDTSPMSNNQIYAACGYSGKDAIIAAMIADPTQDWAYKLLSKAAVGFAFSFNRGN